MAGPFTTPVTPDWKGLLRCIERRGAPDRVHVFELYLDPEIQAAICDRYDVLDGLNATDPHYELRRQIRLQSFLGYDYVRCGLDGLDMPLKMIDAADTAALGHAAGRKYEDEHVGPITTWQELEAYSWPDPARASTDA